MTWAGRGALHSGIIVQLRSGLMLKIRGNDIELNDKKVARLFDLNTFDKRDLEALFDKANNYERDVRNSYENGRDESNERY